MIARERIAVIGLGYVGLPVAAAMAKHHGRVVGFDVKAERVAALSRHFDVTGELSPEELAGLPLHYSTDPSDLADCTVFIVTVPTPIDDNRQPDLTPLKTACATIGKFCKKGAMVVIESTVYPGVTEDVCGPLLAEVSGLQQGVDFTLGYSPERINPGDREHRFETIRKVVSASDAASLARIQTLYGPAVRAGLHAAPSIRVAEAAKVIENTQRDLNIALMNELAIIFDKLGLKTRDVLEAAATKWNFLKFTPGLVGGHCIGVDPYYLTAKAESVGYHPEVILAGRRINDSMGAFIAQRLVRMLAHRHVMLHEARVGVLGLTFKENVPDLRNSRVPDILAELRDMSIRAMVHDPLADAGAAHDAYCIDLISFEQLRELDAIVLAVPHEFYRAVGEAQLAELLKPGGIVIDVKAVLDPSLLPASLDYWSL